MENKYIFIKNQDGEFCKWTIQDENENTYEIRYNGLVTKIYKNNVNVDEDGKFTTHEIKKTEFGNGNFGIITFGIIGLES